MPHTEVINDADLLVFGLRFQNFSPEQMKPIIDYLHRGGPVIGTRTSTHAFNIPDKSPFAALITSQRSQALKRFRSPSAR